MSLPANQVNSGIRVLLVEHTDLVRRGLRDALTTGGEFSMVADISMGPDLEQLLAGRQPSVAIVGIAAGEQRQACPPLAVIRSVIAAKPDARIILLLDDDASIDLILTAIHAGALGLLTHSISGEALRRAVRDVAAGHATVCSPLADRLFDEIVNQQPVDQDSADALSWDPVRVSALTKREIEVLDCIAHGLSNSEAAQQLGLMSATIKTHLRSIYSKLGVANRTSAALTGLSSALLGTNRRPPEGFFPVHKEQAAEKDH